MVNNYHRSSRQFYKKKFALTIRTRAVLATFLAETPPPEIRKYATGNTRGRISEHHQPSPFWWTYGWERFKHAPYSPDLGRPNFDLFPKLKEPFRGCRLPDINTLNEEVSRWARQRRGVLRGIQAFPKRWQSCVDKQGDYTDGLYCCISFKIKYSFIRGKLRVTFGTNLVCRSLNDRPTRDWRIASKQSGHVRYRTTKRKYQRGERRVTRR